MRMSSVECEDRCLHVTQTNIQIANTVIQERQIQQLFKVIMKTHRFIKTFFMNVTYTSMNSHYTRSFMYQNVSKSVCLDCDFSCYSTDDKTICI